VTSNSAVKNPRIISVATEDIIEKNTNFVRNDQVSYDEKIWFFSGPSNQRFHLQRQEIFQTYPVSRLVLNEALETFEDMTGMKLPSEFVQGASVYPLNDLLMYDGVPIPFRVHRQKIYLAASVFPLSEQQIFNLLYHCIGNALWNFLDYKAWRFNALERKNTYRQMRGIVYEDFDVKINAEANRRLMHQQNLFFIASEDFRHLFTPAIAKTTWSLQIGDYPVKPPNPEVQDFWMREVDSYAANAGRV